jgi:hypothetical protein
MPVYLNEVQLESVVLEFIRTQLGCETVFAPDIPHTPPHKHHNHIPPEANNP